MDLREVRPRPHQVMLAEGALRQLAPTSHKVECDQMRNVVVLSAEEIVNVQIRKQYRLKRHQMVENLPNRRDCPRADVMAPWTAKLRDFFSYMRLEARANEVVLFRRTTLEKTALIARQRFDGRLTLCMGEASISQRMRAKRCRMLGPELMLASLLLASCLAIPSWPRGP